MITNQHVLPLPASHTIIIPAIMSSTEFILSSTCWMSPTSVLVCRFRTLFRRMAVNMLQISAWQVTSQCSSSSTMQPMLSASWMMKLVSRSNSPPTNCRARCDRRVMWEKIAFLYLPRAAWSDVDLNFHPQCGCLTQLSPLVFFQVRFFLEGEINQENAFIYFRVTALMWKGWPALEKESGDLFSSLKRFWSEFKHPWK